MRGLGQLMRSTIPRGTREPEPAPWPAQGTPWWGPWTLPWASDGSANPTMIGTYADATSATLAIPAAWRATNLIAGFVAQMGLVSLDGDPPRHIDQGRQLLNNPWPLISYFDWMFGVAASIVLRGNFYAVKADYDQSTGNPRQYIPVSVDDVTVNFENGVLTYDVVGIDRPLHWNQMFHVRGFMLPGMLTGVGVIEAHRTGLFQTRELMDFGSGAYGSGGVPPVVITVDKPELAEGEAEYLQSRWVMRHSAKDRRPAVVPKIVSIEKVGLSMDDAEYLESRKFSIAEIAYMFNLDPSDLGASFSSNGGRIEYSNIEARMRDRLVFSLAPWMNRIEQAYNMDLPGNCHVKFQTADLFRADSLTRMQTYEIAIRNDIMTPEEVRIAEHSPIGDYMLIGMNDEHNISWPPPKDEDLISSDNPTGIPGSPSPPEGAMNPGLNSPAMQQMRERVQATATPPATPTNRQLSTGSGGPIS